MCSFQMSMLSFCLEDGSAHRVLQDIPIRKLRASPGITGRFGAVFRDLSQTCDEPEIFLQTIF